MNSQEPFKREYSWLYIVTPEDKAKYGPKLATDKMLLPGLEKWVPVSDDTNFAQGPYYYRRPISPGPDHEIVPLDRVPDDYGCEMFYCGEWKPFANRSKQTVEAWIKTIPEILAIRRPISKPVESGWVSVKERLPEFGQWVLASPPSTADTKDGFPVSIEAYNETAYRWVRVITHWAPLPEPPRPAAEVAFDSWLHGASIPTCGLKSARDGWEAALVWAKSHLSELSKEGK